MASQDPILGKEIHEKLKKLGIENPIHFEQFQKTDKRDLSRELRSFCNHLGLDLKHPSTEDTPCRVGKMYKEEICWGLDYNKFPKAMTVDNEGDKDEIVLIRNIEVKSLCEHHFMPIIGKAHVAYIPNNKLLGLSKFNRIVEFFSRRPQLQERLSEQIAHALAHILETDDIAVIIEADHLCVKFRGVEDFCSDTVSSKMMGRFKTVKEARQELLSLISMGVK